MNVTFSQYRSLFPHKYRAAVSTCFILRMTHTVTEVKKKLSEIAITDNNTLFTLRMGIHGKILDNISMAPIDVLALASYISL